MKLPTPITNEAQTRRPGEAPYQWRWRRLETMRDLERKLSDANAALKVANSSPHMTELKRIGELVGMKDTETVFTAVKKVVDAAS